MDISKLIAETMCVAAAVVASATLPMSAAATDMAYGDVAEPSRKDARQQEIKEWFLENYFGRTPVGRPGGHDFTPYDFKLFLDFCKTGMARK